MTVYTGGKGQSGVYQAIICQFPPHTTYIEPFLGGGSIMRYKRAALRSIGLDIDPDPIAAFGGGTVGSIAGSDDVSSSVRPGGHAVSGDASRNTIDLICGDALAFLRSYPWQGGELVYCDPPYLMDVRTSPQAYYTHEFSSSEQHIALLQLLTTLPAMVAISGYYSPLYGMMLDGWRSITFTAVKRSGRVATEWLWMNYPEPEALHDYRYLGAGYRERERIQKKIRRWEQKLSAMPRLERLAMLAALEHRQT